MPCCQEGTAPATNPSPDRCAITLTQRERAAGYNSSVKRPLQNPAMCVAPTSSVVRLTDRYISAGHGVRRLAAALRAASW